MMRCHCQGRRLGRAWRFHGEVVLRQRICRGQGCQAVFWICAALRSRTALLQPCLPREARRRQHRAANRRHQRSPEGRLDHRDRQRAYRQRHAPARVTDQSSLSVISPAPFGCGETITMPVAVPLPSHCPAGWKSAPISGCAARSVAGQAASSILSHIFHDEGELR